MRGCLFVVLFAAAVIGAVAWFGAPLLASTVIETALQNGGFHAARSTVTATSNPPPKLLLGHADRVEIQATDVDFRAFHAASLDLVLTNVDILGRTAGRISGEIGGTDLTTSGGATTSADVAIDGPASGATARIVVDGATVSRIVVAAMQSKLGGVAVTSTTLIAPDILRISAAGATVEGRLVIDASGALALSTALGSSTILTLDPSFPLKLTGLRVVAGNLEVDGTLDARRLLGG